MQRLTRCSVVLSLLALLGTWSPPAAAAQTGTVRCESRGQDIVQCPIARQRPGGARPHPEPGSLPQGPQLGRGGQLRLGERRLPRGLHRDRARGTGRASGNASANPNQLRACRSEADRRMPAYSYDQIPVEPASPGRGASRTCGGGRDDDRPLRGGRQRPGAAVHHRRGRRRRVEWRRRHHPHRLRVPADRAGGVPDPGGRPRPAPPPDQPEPLPPQRHLRPGRRLHLGGRGVPGGVRGRDGGRRAAVPGPSGSSAPRR